MPKKSVSLFEVLPPSQAPKKSAAPAAATPEPEAPAPERAAAPAPKPKTRQSVSMESDMAAAPAPSASYKKKSTSAKVQSHSVEGVSVREKSDPFYLVLVCMVVLAIVSGLAGYRLGYNKGVEKGASYTLEEKSQKALPARPAIQQPPVKEKNSSPPTYNASLKTPLPTSVKKLSPEQTRATIPPEELKKYTLQVQTFGRKAIPSAKELVQAIRSKGHDAFYDKNDGSVMVGRFKTTDSLDAKRLKNDLVRFNWRKADFSESYFRSIPKHLLEP